MGDTSGNWGGVGGDAYERWQIVKVKYGKVRDETYEAVDSYVEGVN